MCCDAHDRLTRYERNRCRTGPIQSNLTRKQNYESKTVDDVTIYNRSPYRKLIEKKLTSTFEEKTKEKTKTTYKEVTENSNASSKNFKSELKKKINYDAVEKSQSQSKKFDAIDARL